jgi:hypothetical protein
VLPFNFVAVQWDPRLKGDQFTETLKYSNVPLFPENTEDEPNYSPIVAPPPLRNTSFGLVQGVITTLQANASESTPSPQQFAQLYNATMGSVPDYFGAFICATYSAIIGAVRLANSTNPGALVNALQSYYEVNRHDTHTHTHTCRGIGRWRRNVAQSASLTALAAAREALAAHCSVCFLCAF